MKHLKTLRSKNGFSRPQLALFALVFALVGYLIFRALAAPNPNLPGDLNGDNTVNITDLSILLSNYGTSNSTADINGDGTVNVLDMSILLSNYGKTYSANNTNCTDSTTAWQNAPFTQQTGSFTASFYATPSAAGDNVVAGLSASAAGAYSDMAAIVRFNPTNTIDARNGGAYAALNNVPYVAGQSYYFELYVNVTNHTYAAYVTPSGGVRTQIADNYVFRTEQASVPNLGYLDIYGEVGTMHVCNPIVNGQSVTFTTQGGGVGTVSCTATISNANSLINTYNAAKAGDTICLGPGVTIDQGEIDFTQSIGAAGAPITITSADYSHPGTILGRLVMLPPATYITFSHLILNTNVATTASTYTINSDHITFSHDDISDNHTGICLNPQSNSYGTAHYTVIDANRIHDCGPYGSNEDHGIYDFAYYTTITNNFIYNNAARGIQLRGAQGATVRYNTLDNNGEGIIFGEVTASNNTVYDNIFSNSNVRFNVEEFWDPTSAPIGTNNNVYDSCVWATNADSYYNTNGGVLPGMIAVTTTNLKNANPMYVNTAAKDYRLLAGSPCAGYGVQPGVVPGP